MTKASLTCPECGAMMQLRETTKYRHRDGSPRKFYGCSRFPQCKAIHGAHPDGRPLGIPANKETKAARIVAHDAFDAIWRDRRLMTRAAAYAWLARKLGHTAHMGEMGIDECNRVVALCETFDINDPDAVEAIAGNQPSDNAKQRAKWKEQRKNWSRKKRTEYNRAKRKRQKANRAARKANQTT